jgi:hypothetical protein
VDFVKMALCATTEQVRARAIALLDTGQATALWVSSHVEYLYVFPSVTPKSSSKID